MIPACWPQHPHIARELAVLASLRWSAEESTTPDDTEEWHRYSFPMFCDRMGNRLGESSCRTAKHIDWPAEGRYTVFVDDNEASAQRQRVVYDDTRPVAQLHQAL
jgi:hypothetical protein